MSWMEKDFEIEMSLEQRELEREIADMKKEYEIPAWDMMHDLDDVPDSKKLWL